MFDVHDSTGVVCLKILIIGYGEIGRPLYEVVRGVYNEVDWLDVGNKTVHFRPNILHIAFPEQGQSKFVENSVEYIERFLPELAIIESTVTPGTTTKIRDKLTKKVLLCHSPIRGNVAQGMKKGILQYTKYIGPISKEAGAKAKEYYESLGLKTRICPSPVETEVGKLFETTYRGLMMAWFQETYRVCESLAADYDAVVEFIGSTEREGKQPRPIFHPGLIGGHCIIPNAEKLYSVYNSKFVEALLESNKRRARELAVEKSV